MKRRTMPFRPIADTAEQADPLQVATARYGIANWHFYNPRREKAREYFEKIVAGRQCSA